VADPSAEDFEKAFAELLKQERENAEEEHEVLEEEKERAKAEERAARAEEEAAKNDKKAGNNKPRNPAPGEGLVRSALRGARNALNTPVSHTVRRVSAPVVRPLVSIGSGLSDHVESHGAKWLFFIVLITHWVDLRSGLTRNMPYGSVWAVWYLFIALVLAPFFLKKFRGYYSVETGVYVLLSVLSWFLPKMLAIIPRSVTGNPYFQVFMLLTSFWIGYLLFNPHGDSFLEKMRVGWLIFWTFILLVVAFKTTSTAEIPRQLQGEFSMKPFEALGELWQSMTEGLSLTFKRLFGMGSLIKTAINKNLNDTLGRSYTGQVDPYTHRELGVRITDLRARDNVFFEGSPVVVWATIEGESFHDEVTLSLRCYAFNNKKELFEGVISAQTIGDEEDVVHFFGYQATQASCTFENLSKGVYDVHVVGVFNFETWAYIQYYFTSFELLQQLIRDDVDPATYFGVEKYPVAVYSSGPVVLGLASEAPQPIPLARDHPSRSLPAFGASLENAWVDGEIAAVRSITLLVPPPFSLKKCDQTPVSGTKADPGFEEDENSYRVYVFREDENRGASSLRSATCLLSLDTPEDVDSLLGGFDLVMKTFVGKTEYLYSIEDSIRVRVE